MRESLNKLESDITKTIENNLEQMLRNRSDSALPPIVLPVLDAGRLGLGDPDDVEEEDLVTEQGDAELERSIVDEMNTLKHASSEKVSAASHLQCQQGFNRSFGFNCPQCVHPSCRNAGLDVLSCLPTPNVLPRKNSNRCRPASFSLVVVYGCGLLLLGCTVILSDWWFSVYRGLRISCRFPGC